MKRKASEALTKRRTAFRRHAKRRFEERFELALNRDDLRTLEQRIRDGQAIRTGRGRPGRSEWLVEVEGRIVPVIYDKSSQRIVTALPGEALTDIPPDVLRSARLWLVAEVQQQIIAGIDAGRFTLLWVKDEDTSFHVVEYEGELFHVGYKRSEARLVPYRSQPVSQRRRSSGGTGVPTLSHDGLFQRLDLPDDTAESIRTQIRTGQSLCLWRYSKSLVFHQVVLGTEQMRLGYNKARDRFYAWQEPPESMPELRSSVRLFGCSPEILREVGNTVRNGTATLVETRGEHSVYTVELDGETHYFVYYPVRQEIQPYVPARRAFPSHA